MNVAFRHFPLHPDTPEGGLTLEELFAGRGIDISEAQTRMSRLMAAEGLRCGNRTMTYNSRLAQELAKWAELEFGNETIHDELFRAYFVDNLNLAKIDNLLTIAQQVGLPAAEAKSVLESRQYRQAVDADWQKSRDLGITGVPTFVIGNRGLVGAQAYEQLEALVASAGVQRRDP